MGVVPKIQLIHINEMGLRYLKSVQEKRNSNLSLLSIFMY